MKLVLDIDIIILIMNFKFIYIKLNLKLLMLNKLFEGGYKYCWWKFLNLFTKPFPACLCTMREECRTCWTKFNKTL